MCEQCVQATHQSFGVSIDSYNMTIQSNVSRFLTMFRHFIRDGNIEHFNDFLILKATN